MLSIRDVDPLGADALALLHEAAIDARALYPELFAGSTVAPTNEPLPARGVYVVAYLHEQPVACGALRPFDDTTAELRRMYVHREHRRQGLARAVLSHLEAEARRLGYSKLVLETGRKQVPAMRLWEASGFQHIPPFGAYANDPASVCYERILDVLTNVKNLLYRRPELYELVYPEPNDETPTMLRGAFARHLPRPPTSILDIGCGTGRDLASLARDGANCVGVDALAAMVSLASSRYPHVSFLNGDMRSIRLGNTFDAVLCMGSALMYALTNADLRASFRTFASHSHPGSLLFLDVNNAAACLPGGTFSRELKSEVNVNGFRAVATMLFDFDYRRQLMIRSRKWKLEDGETIEDFCEYRLLFPAELEAFLDDAGFDIVGMYDNQQLTDTLLNGPRLYIAATFRG